jgi:hypothetical protein
MDTRMPQPNESLASVVARYRFLNDRLSAAHPELAASDARRCLDRGDTRGAVAHTLRALDRLLPAATTAHAHHAHR